MPAVYPLVHILSIFITGLARVILSLAEYLKRKRKQMGFQEWSGYLHWDKFYPVPVPIHIKNRNPQANQQNLSLAIAGFYSHPKARKKKMFNMKQQKQLMLKLMERKNQQMEKHSIMSSPAETAAQFGASVAGSDILLLTAFFPCMSFLGSLV